MNVKKLSKLYYIKKNIKQLKEELAELNNLGSAPLNDMPKGNGVSDPTNNFVTRKENLIKRINAAKFKYLSEYEKITEFLDTIEDEEIKLIARLRFIKCLDWFDIAEEISPPKKSIHWTTPRKKLIRYIERNNI